ncbi:Non-canonical purine NTP pyrophosphatase [Phycisphaerae bacterium RAS1]|nr:Non-canonical purine NTP pyrophosphatase [Phycisphaerae bacterium RAS1]
MTQAHYEILLATRSTAKIREIRQMTADAPIRWRGLDEFPGVPEAPEEEATFAGNARSKAFFYARHTGLPTLADDSGLEVDALDGKPGVNSAYFAGTPRDDQANNRRLIAELAGVARERRTARYRCVMVFVDAGRVLFETTGSMEGLIMDEPRGAGGFGYDPYFFVPACGRTAAELSAEEKNAISHRGHALRDALRWLQRLAGS